MRCYYPYVNYVPSAVTREDQFGRLKGCTSSTPVTSSVTLSDVLAVGNSAGIYDILMNGQDILGANLIETRILQINDTINNPSIIQLTGPVLSYLAGANSSSHQFITKSNTGVSSTPVTISSNSTTITNATTINNLSSTTQPNGTNNTSVATTAFVQSAIPSTSIPYLYGFVPSASSVFSSNFSINFTNGATLGLNTYFTLRIQFQYTWNTTGISALNNYYTNYAFLMDIYPKRVPTIGAGGIGVCLPNGNINGNSNYVMTDPTYAPNGRWYWVRDYSSSSATPASPTEQPNPLSFISNSQQNVVFIVRAPDLSASSYYTLETSVELINRSSGTTITSNNVSGCFTLGSYYNTF
jgi:hypothetical protein